MKRILRLFVALACIFSIGCAPVMYYYGSYSHTLYRYKKTPNEENLEKHLPKLDPFLKYYEECYQIFNHTLINFESKKFRLDIIKRKLAKWKGEPLEELSENVTNFILEIKDAKLIRHLTILEGKIQAIPDLTSNICENIENILAKVEAS